MGGRPLILDLCFNAMILKMALACVSVQMQYAGSSNVQIWEKRLENRILIY